ncbi:MAG TPA: hypothetical protein PL041_07705 [Melioribacteraceae bacterium]|nr:hypothetical protein [Melioribacteraceae bacterium]
MKQRVRINKTKVLQAIPGSRGIISLIASRIGSSWAGLDAFIKKNPDVLQAYNDELNKTLDLVEDKMFDMIDEGCEGLIKFYLAKKGKERGYGEENHKLDITTAGEPINVIRLVEVVKEENGTDN